ncbi:MAG: LPS export ABC transporter ATP-binding protein [Alphaproteobacteria bacterium]
MPQDMDAVGEGLLALHIGKRWKRRQVLRDVSLGVRRGEAVGLLGPNGAGKTTCFYILAGLTAPDYGQVILDGMDVSRLPLYRRARLGIGYLPQEPSAFRGMTVLGNIAAAAELVESDRTKRKADIERLLESFSLGHLSQTPAQALSGGERRRLEIARALAARPKFLLLDEPLAGIDPVAVAEVRGLVRKLTEWGVGVLITDHNVRDTLDLVDRAYILHDGAVMMHGTPKQVIENEDVRRVYLGETFRL